jgi:hypothetical protein
VIAKEAQQAMQQWLSQATPLERQLDRRWVGRYRELAAYDSYWWLTWAGPFSEEEQQQWDRLFLPPVEEVAKEQLALLLKQSRERELAAAIAEQREPCLHYPAIEIEEVRHRIANLLELNTEIGQEEPNAIVRRLYHGAIEEELDFLRLIEATYEGDTEQFQACMLRLCPIPTVEGMEYALARVRQSLRQGLKRPETIQVSQHLDEFLRTRLHLTFDLTSPEDDLQEGQQQVPQSSSQPQRMVSAQTARQFFEAALRECGYDGWRVVIDPNGAGTRVEQGLRQMFLPEQWYSLERIRHLFAHELLGHVARCIVGERSPLGLLGIHTRNSLLTEEGVAIYHERQVAALHGQPFNDATVWFGTLATGLASGVVTPHKPSCRSSPSLSYSPSSGASSSIQVQIHRKNRNMRERMLFQPVFVPIEVSPIWSELVCAISRMRCTCMGCA